MNKKLSNREAKDWAAILIVVLTGAAVGWIASYDPLDFLIIVSPLAALIPLYHLIKWAVVRCYRMWREHEEKPLIGHTAKTVAIVATSLLVAVAPAKAIDDNLAGAYAGIYAHWFVPEISRIWSNAYNQFIWAYTGGKGGNYDGR